MHRVATTEVFGDIFTTHVGCTIVQFIATASAPHVNVDVSRSVLCVMNDTKNKCYVMQKQ